HFHFIALLPIAQQRRHGHAKLLAEQVEQRRFQCGNRMDGDTQIEGLQAAAGGVAVGEGLPRLVEDAVEVPDRAPEYELASVFERLPNGFAAGHLAYADMAGAVLEDQDIAGEPGPMCAAEIEQHAVLTGDWNDLQV